ncbi:MAG: FAD-dependent oxidoreductase [Deltaproteobacteria bacterium]|nr:FAD-dependent oxidoreductase [Deltaproteobacteria bacterium]MBN2673272.1 FAD-dependent oxidoreductase [Deltaproteobacteria bacterium]
MSVSLGVTIPQSTDVVVIGAGLGGLISAVELARQGLDVCVFEKQLEAGGYAHNFRRKGFHFDVSLHHIGGFSPGSLTHGILESLGILEKLQLTRPKTLFKADFPDFSISLPNDKDRIIAILSKEFPHEADGIRALFEFLPRLKNDVIAPTMVPDFNVPIHDRVSTEYLDRTYQQLLQQYVGDPRLLAVLGQMWSYIGIPPSQSAANFSACVNASAFVEGEWGILGGGAALVRDILERLRELGGDCYVSKEVVEIVVENGEVVGARLDDGRLVRAKVVISATNPVYTFDQLVNQDDVSEIYRYRLRQMTPSLSMYAMYLGLDCSADSLGMADSNYFFNHDVNPDKAFEKVLKHEIEKTDYCYNNATMLQASVAPAGCSIVSFMEPTPSFDWLEIPEDDYRKRKNEVRATLLDKYEQKFPGLRKHILVDEFFTPRSLAAITNNHEGAVYGFSQSPEQSNNRRLRNRTPIKGLFLSGAWTWAGGGYEGAMTSGVQTARTIMQEYKIPYKAPFVRLHSDSKEIIQHADGTQGDGLIPLIPFDDAVSLDSHYKYIFRVSVYGDELNSRGNADASSYLRYLDRARMEAIEEICGDESSWHREYQIKVYRIEARCATVVRLADKLEVRTGIRRITNHRASFDQRIINTRTGRVVCDATVEVLFLDKDDNLVSVPEGLVNTDDAIPNFESDRTEPLPFKYEDQFPFRTRFRVYFEDTDLQSIMFHVSYVRFCERALFDLVQSIWPDVSTNVWMTRTNATLSRIDIRYLKAAVLGDKVEVRTTLMGMDVRKLSFGQRVVKVETGEVLADTVTDVEFRDPQGNYFPVPKQIADIAQGQLAQMEQ